MYIHVCIFPMGLVKVNRAYTYMYIHDNNDLFSSVPFYLCILRSAPASPTHHPFMTDIKDSDGGYLIHTQSNTSALHPFTLPPYLVNSTSHSLPPSPSRLATNPPGYPPGQALRFFTPLRVQSTSADALALESRRRVEEGSIVEIPSKKPRLSNELLDPSQHPKNIIIRSPQPAMMAPQQAMPCYPMPQATPIRYPPFVGMPMFVPQGFSAIALQETKGDKERDMAE